jgi:hypothetical protein
MSKQANKKATLQDFLSKKIKKEENKNKTIDVYVTSMDKTITLKKPSEERIFEYINDIGDNSDFKTVIDANKKMIYDCCEELHNPELLEALELKDPYDIPNVLFELGDIKEIMNQFNSLIGNQNVEEEIKN